MCLNQPSLHPHGQMDLQRCGCLQHQVTGLREFDLRAAIAPKAINCDFQPRSPHRLRRHVDRNTGPGRNEDGKTEAITAPRVTPLRAKPHTD